MKSNTLRNLVIVAIGLSGLAWFAAQRDQAGYAPEDIGQYAPALESRLSDITRVAIQAAGEEGFVLERNGDDWIVPAK